jgi:23S rRNA (cytidine2498-2'-O)-methyltransferase
MRFIISTDPDFTPAALDELRALHPAAVTNAAGQAALVQVVQELAAGVTLIEVVGAERPFVSALTATPPVFVRHIIPVHATVTLTNTEADLPALVAAVRDARQFGRLGPDEAFSIQARFVTAAAHLPERSYSTSDLRAALAPVVRDLSGASENVKEPEVVVSLVLDDTTGYVGISSVTENLSDWAGGQHRFARDPNQISRAEFKLLEALDVFKLHLPKQGKALDLGAAPGGWTRLLLDAGLSVVAVDPALLDIRLKPTKDRLRHIPGRAQGFLDRARHERARYNVILSDIRIDAPDAARLMVQAADILDPNGFALTTLKLPHPAPGVDPLALLDEALAILSKRYSEVAARQLFHNRHEVTVLLIP